MNTNTRQQSYASRQDAHGDTVIENNNVTDQEVTLPEEIPDDVLDAAIEKRIKATHRLATKRTPAWNDKQGYIVS